MPSPARNSGGFAYASQKPTFMRESQTRQGLKTGRVAMSKCANIAILTVLGALLASCSNDEQPQPPVASIRARTVEPRPLGGPRARHSATLLGNGTVLVAGGVSDEGGASTPLASTELYVSAVVGFESLPPLEHARY